MEEQTSGIDILRAVVTTDFESQTDFARAIGKPQSSVYELLSGERKKVPAEWCAKIEEATGGKVKRHQLRPDLWQETGAAQ